MKRLRSTAGVVSLLIDAPRKRPNFKPILFCRNRLGQGHELVRYMPPLAVIALPDSVQRIWMEWVRFLRHQPRCSKNRCQSQ